MHATYTFFDLADSLSVSNVIADNTENAHSSGDSCRALLKDIKSLSYLIDEQPGMGL